MGGLGEWVGEMLELHRCVQWQTCCDATRMKINFPVNKNHQSMMAQLDESTVGSLGTAVPAVQNRLLSSTQASFWFNAPLQSEFPLGDCSPMHEHRNIWEIGTSQALKPQFRWARSTAARRACLAQSPNHAADSSRSACGISMPAACSSLTQNCRQELGLFDVRSG